MEKSEIIKKINVEIKKNELPLNNQYQGTFKLILNKYVIEKFMIFFCEFM